MEMSCGHSLRMECTCSVCRQAMDEERSAQTAITVALFGRAAYAICCCCRQEVEDRKDPNYRKRWKRWAKKLAGKAKP